MAKPGFLSGMGRYVLIFFHYAAQYMKTKMAYRSDFFVYVFSEFLQQSVNLIFILVVFTKVPDIKGWNREEIMFIYGFFLVPFAFYSGLFNHLFDVAEKYVLQGEMDRVLTRPLNTLFQVVVETMNLELMLGIIPGLAIIYYSAGKLGLVFHWRDLPLALTLVAGAVLIYGGVYTVLASLGFWFEGNMGLMPMVYNLSNYGRYPTNIYRGVIRVILTWILPFAFVGFYPATVLLRRWEYWPYAALTPVIGVVFFTVAYIVWNRGIRVYRGTGS